MGCFPHFPKQYLLSPPLFPPLPMIHCSWPPPPPPLPLAHFTCTHTFLPSLWHISLIVTSSSFPYEGYLVVFTKLPAFWCAWFPCLCLRAFCYRIGTALSSFFFFFFVSDVFGEACLTLLTRWGGIISSACHRYNNLARPRMGKIGIYHVQ